MLISDEINKLLDNKKLTKKEILIEYYKLRYKDCIFVVVIKINNDNITRVIKHTCLSLKALEILLDNFDNNLCDKSEDHFFGEIIDFYSSDLGDEAIKHICLYNEKES